MLTQRHPRFGVRILRACLRVLSWPYQLAATAKNLAYDWGIRKTHSSPLPTICVGNLSVGGTGKSPVVTWIARWLREKDLRVAILSRGYGQLDHGQNDEALELELRLPDVPHLQHWDRVASAELAAAELDMQCLVLDDGFQHRRMGRDLDIVLIDSTDPPAARRVLPAGLFREPLSSLSRAQVIVLTRVDQAIASELTELKRQVKNVAPHAQIVEATHAPSQLTVFPDESVELDRLNGKSLLAFCAIGNPESFFRSLENLGAKILDRRTWPDHHGYDQSDVESLRNWADHWARSNPPAEMLVCTMKDWVKIQTARIGRLPLAAMVIDLSFLDGRSHLEDHLLQVIDRICGDDAPQEANEK